MPPMVTSFSPKHKNPSKLVPNMDLETYYALYRPLCNGNKDFPCASTILQISFYKRIRYAK